MQPPLPLLACQSCSILFVVVLLKEHTPVHHEHLSVPFHFGNSSSHWFSKGCQAAAVKGGEAVRLVLLVSQGRRRKLTSEASRLLKPLLEERGSIQTSVATTAGKSFHGIVETGNKCGCSDIVSQTAFPMLSEKSHVEAFTGLSLAG